MKPWKVNALYRSVVGFTGFLLGIGLLAISVGCASQQTIAESPEQLADLGRLQEAVAAGLDVPMCDDLSPPPCKNHYWEEVRDGGDKPLEPCCACYYELPDCRGDIVGRAVDECFPDDGVSLNEKTIPTDCKDYDDKDYNCEKLLGKGAECKLIELECCGVKTTSGYCYIDVEG